MKKSNPKKYKFIIVIRHGELDNPKRIVYNRDEVMKKEEIIHLSDYGKEQMRLLGELIKKRKFRVAKIFHSPETRVRESTHELNKILRVIDVAVKKELDEVYGPGGYIEGINIDQWENDMRGDAYDESRWGKYHHEKPEEIIKRMEKIFWEIERSLKIGETGILVSHGDPIAWWINYKLRSLFYPKKGEAIVVIVDSQGKIFSHYILNEK